MADSQLLLGLTLTLRSSSTLALLSPSRPPSHSLFLSVPSSRLQQLIPLRHFARLVLLLSLSILYSCISFAVQSFAPSSLLDPRLLRLPPGPGSCILRPVSDRGHSQLGLTCPSHRFWDVHNFLNTSTCLLVQLRTRCFESSCCPSFQLRKIALPFHPRSYPPSSPHSRSLSARSLTPESPVRITV
jgi:hypothetical protein